MAWSDAFGHPRVEPVEAVATGRVLEYLVPELFAGGLEGLDQMLDLDVVHVFVVRVGVDEDRRLQLLCVPHGAVAFVLFDILVSRLANVAGRRVERR